MSDQVRLLGQVKYPCPGCKRWVLCDLYWRGAYCQLSIHDHTPPLVAEAVPVVASSSEHHGGWDRVILPWLADSN